MNRLDMIVEAIYSHGSVSGPTKENGGWTGSYVVFRPGKYHISYYGKTSVSFRSESPGKSTIEREVKAEIKYRLLEREWYRSGLRRLLEDIVYTEISVPDDFSKRLVTLSGYKHKDCPGLCSNYTMALGAYLSQYKESLWDEVTEIGKPYGSLIKTPS